MISAVAPAPLPAIFDSHSITVGALSFVIARISVMFGYTIRFGRTGTKSLWPSGL